MWFYKLVLQVHLHKSIIKCYFVTENDCKMKLDEVNEIQLWELHSISRNSLIIHWPIDVNFSKWTMSCLLKEKWNQIFPKCVRRGDM